MIQEIQDQNKKWILLAGLILLACYALGIVFPEPFWATHWPGLLPILPRTLIFIAAILLFSLPLWRKKAWKWAQEPNKLAKGQKHIIYIGLSLFVAILYLLFPIAEDIYGDAIFIKQGIEITIPKWDNRLILEPLQPDFFNTKVGLMTYYQLNNLFAWLFGLRGDLISPWLGAISGGIFAFLWIKFVDLHLDKMGWKVLFLVVGLTAPLNVAFMGHYETYFLSYTAILGWISALGIYFKTKSLKWLIALPFLFLIVLQTHITNWLLLPGLAMAFAWHFQEKIQLPYLIEN